MGAQRIEAIVTDIEGTTSALTFVKDVLFPYAAKHIAEYVKANSGNAEVRAILDEVREIEKQPDLSEDGCVQVLLQWIEQDRKIRPLKAIQGMIWEKGFRDGEFKGHIYDDAVRKLKEWHASGFPLYIYSSGSVPAQKLLFGYTAHGDLTPLFSGYFDTNIGAKVESESYRKIAANLNKQPASILFLSDHVGELDAAKAAGYTTVLLDRDGIAPRDAQHARAVDFNSISPGEIA